MSEFDPDNVVFDPEVRRSDLLREIGERLSSKVNEAIELNRSFGINESYWRFDLEPIGSFETRETAEEKTPRVVVSPHAKLETSKTRGLIVAMTRLNEDGEIDPRLALYGVYRNKRTLDVERVTFISLDESDFDEDLGGVEVPIGLNVEEEAKFVMENVAKRRNAIQNFDLEAITGLTSFDADNQDLEVLLGALSIMRPNVPSLDSVLANFANRLGIFRVI